MIEITLTLPCSNEESKKLFKKLYSSNGTVKTEVLTQIVLACGKVAVITENEMKSPRGEVDNRLTIKALISKIIKRKSHGKESSRAEV